MIGYRSIQALMCMLLLSVVVCTQARQPEPAGRADTQKSLQGFCGLLGFWTDLDIGPGPMSVDAIFFPKPLPALFSHLPGSPTATFTSSGAILPTNQSVYNPANEDLLCIIASEQKMLYYNGQTGVHQVVSLQQAVCAPVLLNGLVYAIEVVENTPGLPFSFKLVTIIPAFGTVNPGPLFTSPYPLNSYFYGEYMSIATNGVDEIYLVSTTNLVIITDVNTGSPNAHFFDLEPQFSYNNDHRFLGLEYKQDGVLLAIAQRYTPALSIDLEMIEFDLMASSVLLSSVYNLMVLPVGVGGTIINSEFYSTAYDRCDNTYYISTMDEMVPTSTRLIEININTFTHFEEPLPRYLFGLEVSNQGCCNTHTMDCSDLHWAVPAGGGRTDFGRAITTDADGNVYTTGAMGEQASFGSQYIFSASGAQDAFVAKQDIDGNFVWVTQLGGNGIDEGTGIVVAPSGDVYVSGLYNHGVSTGVGAFVARLNAAGALLQIVYMHGSGNTANGIAIDGDGNIYVTGRFYGITNFGGSIVLGDVSNTDGWGFAAKLDPQLNFLWAKQFSGTGSVIGKGIAVDGAGRVVVTGSFFGVTDFDPGVGSYVLSAPGLSDVFLCKLTGSGDFVWARQIGGDGEDVGEAIVIDAMENIYITGALWGNGTTANGLCPGTIFPEGIRAAFVAKFTRQGHCMWGKYFKGISTTSLSWGNGIALDRFGEHVYTTGLFEQTVDFDPGYGTALLDPGNGTGMYISVLTAAHGEFVHVLQNVTASTSMGFDLKYSSDIAIDANACIHTTGGFFNQVDFDPSPSVSVLSSQGHADIFIQKICCCCPEYNQFLNNANQGWTIHVDPLTCSVTITSPVLNDCYWFELSDWGDGSSGDLFHGSGAWTHTYAQSGTYHIEVVVQEMHAAQPCWSFIKQFSIELCCADQPVISIADADICRANQSVSIPLDITHPGNCTITQVQWYVMGCSQQGWPSMPYQVDGGNQALLLLIQDFINESCVLVKADIYMTCCGVQYVVTTNVATLTLVDLVACSLNIPAFSAYCGTHTPPLLTTPITAGITAIEWYYNGDLVSTAATYQPPSLTFVPQECHTDHVFTVKVYHVCGMTTCAATIRIHNPSVPPGILEIDPAECGTPYCYGEDFTLKYTPSCPSPYAWSWHISTLPSPSTGDFVPLPQAGTQSMYYNTNRLYETTWYMVMEQNGPCQPVYQTIEIPVKDPLVITGFDAFVDPVLQHCVNLKLHFIPSQAAGHDCDGNDCYFVVDWYRNGEIIHTSMVNQSAAAHVHCTTPTAGVYYARVRDVCCPHSAVSAPIIIEPDCMPVIVGPCYRCYDDNLPITLTGMMVLPPNLPCPGQGACTYQWYDNTNGQGLLLQGETGMTLVTHTAGTFVFESTCNGIINKAEHTVIQCSDPCPTVPWMLSLQNVTLNQSDASCFNAMHTLYVAGGGTDFVLNGGASATLIAGHSIRLLPGVAVHAGAYMHAYISQVYCPTQIKAEAMPTQTIFPELVRENSLFRVYPNPTTSAFSLELTALDTDRPDARVVIEIFSMLGNRILMEELPYQPHYQFSLEQQQPGIYFIRVLQGNKAGTERIIKQ